MDEKAQRNISLVLLWHIYSLPIDQSLFMVYRQDKCLLFEVKKLNIKMKTIKEGRYKIQGNMKYQ